jgi:O-antigen/teichoic acid export membrane protein
LAGTTRDLLLLLGFDVAVSIPVDTFGCGLVALQRYDLLNATLIGVAVGQAVAWTVVLLNGGGLLLLGIVSVSISLVGQGVRYLLLRRLLPGISISPSRFERSLVRSLASPAGWYALGNLTDNFRDQASVLILGLVQSVSGAGIFAVGDKLATLGTQMGTPVVEPFFPHAATLVGRGDEIELAQAARTGTRVTAGVTIPFCLMVALLARPALIAWVGPAYERATPAVVILAAAFGLRSLCSAPLMLLGGAGGQRLVAGLGVAKVSLQIVLSAVLGAMFGITGVAVAILAAVVAVDTGLNLPIITRRLGTRFTLTVLPVLRAHVIPFVIAGAGGWFLAQDSVLGYVRSHNRLAGLVVVAAAGLGILLAYVALFVLTGVGRATRRRTVTGLRHPWRTGRRAFASAGRMPPPTARHVGGETNATTPSGGDPDPRPDP